MNEQTKLNLTHLMRPAAEKPSGNGAAPVLLLLHGRGADEEDLMGLEEALDPRFVVVSPRAPYKVESGWAWYGRTSVTRPNPDSFQASISDLRTFIAGLPAAYNTDPARTYILGFSQGAIIGSGLLLAQPELAAGLVMHSGYLPAAIKGNTEITGEVHPENLRGKPIFIAHGTYDDVVPLAGARYTYEYLKKAHAEVLYREYPIGHSISEESLYDVSEWLTRLIGQKEVKMSE